MEVANQVEMFPPGMSKSNFTDSESDLLQYHLATPRTVDAFAKTFYMSMYVKQLEGLDAGVVGHR